MKNKLFIVSLVALAMSISWSSFAQEGRFSLHAGPSFPLSDFGDDDYNDFMDGSGLAAVGISLGGKYVYTLNQDGLGLFIDADLNINGLKSDSKDDIEDDFKSLLGEAIVVYFSRYINIPITAGLNYTVKANEQVSLFGEAGIGADFLKITDLKIDAGNGIEDVEMNFDSSAKLAFIFGGGLIVNDKIIIGLNYYGLGEHNIKGKVKSDDSSADLDDFKQKVTLLTITLGVKF